MSNTVLDELIERGQISSYTYETCLDTNMHNDKLCYEKLTITFNDGTKITVSPAADFELIE